MKKCIILDRIINFLDENTGYSKEELLEDNISIGKNYNKPYYVYADIERRGCFESFNDFVSINELNDMIDSQMNGNAYDKFIIFDVLKNKIVKLTTNGLK